MSPLNTSFIFILVSTIIIIIFPHVLLHELQTNSNIHKTEFSLSALTLLTI